MATPNELYEAIDVIFDGLIDPREIIEKMNPTPEALHVPGVIGGGAKLKRRIKPYIGTPTGSVRANATRQPGAALNRRLQEKKGGLSKGFALKDVGVGSKNILNEAKRLFSKTTPGTRAKAAAKQHDSAVALDQAQARGRKHLVKLGLGTGAAVGATGGAYGMARHKNKQFAQMTQPKSPVIKSMTWNADISGIDDDKRQVFGWATVTHVNGEEVIDRQGDYIPLEEIEKAAYNYVLTSRVGGDMHSRDGDAPKHTADLIESVIVTPEKAQAMGIDDAKNYGWWIGMKVNDDEQWNLVKNGERTGISIHGKGKRVDHE